MAKTRIRTVEFLPEIFRTSVNKQFLAATLDQLVQDPKLKQTQGYIGRRAGPGVTSGDSYVLEPTKTRTDYQLEPGVCWLKPNTNTVENTVTYPGLIDSLAVKGANVSRQDRLFESEYYSWDPFVNFDKLINFSQYYWLPEGPESVDVFATPVALTDNFTVTRNADNYTFSGVPGENPALTLARQGNYTFDVQQTGSKFWIQAAPGISGTMPQASNQSSRDVLGVINNGDDNGRVTFDVPDKNAQNFFFSLDDAGDVDLASTIPFDQINNIYVSEFLQQYGGIDGIQDLQNRTVIFLTNSGWNVTSLFDSNTEGYDQIAYDQTTPIPLDSQRYSVWRINFVFDDPLNPYMRLTVARPVNNLSRLLIQYGNDYSNIGFYKDASGVFQRVPLITATADVLYYQDANNPELFGVIRLVDNVSNQTLNISDIIDKRQYVSPNGVVFSNGLKVQFQGPTEPASYSGNEYYVEGVGTAIQLLPVLNYITPETYTRSTTVPYDSTPYDVTAFDDSLNAPLDPDYLTINRASADLNAWTRSNRWFHIDIINDTASYNGTVPVLDNNFRAKRPIIEFVPNLKLFDFGTQGILAVDIVDFRETDAMSNINGSIGYSIDGYAFINGSRVIFAADRDPAVRNRVYSVTFIQPSGSGTPVIDLQPADLNAPAVPVNQVVVTLSGITQQGKSYYFNGVTWIPAQQKTAVNQAPLFDVFDENGVSFSDTLVYPGSSFIGTKLFSYAPGEGVTDKVIGQPLKYLTINNIGDIVFDNNLYIDTFVYVDNTFSVELPINDGIIRQYNNRIDFQQLLGWQAGYSEQVSRQSFTFVYNNEDLIVDIPVDINSVAIPVKVFANSIFVNTADYTYTVVGNTTVISFVNAPALGSTIEVTVISNVPSTVGFYTVPLNLENNAVNANVTELTLGTIRNHYNTICQNLKDFSGPINGANNSRDLGNLVPYGEIVLQQASPLTLASTFVNNSDFDFFKSIEYSSQQYEKFKSVLIDTVVKNNFQNMTAAEILDECFEIINIGKSEIVPFYWTDTLPASETFDQTVYTITPISTNVFDTLYTYNFTEANYRGILIYRNNVQLIGNNIEYSVATDGPRVTVHVPLNVGDTLTIREYTTTVGNFVPSTPTKLGLYPSYVPEIFLDDTYVDPTLVIRGHDGSITVAFQDVRDDVILEFEKRIYNNIKTRGNPVPLTLDDVVPGQFRTTNYTQAEITNILATSFLSWVGTNKLAYREQEYLANNAFTWNYTSSDNKLDGETLLGNWRGIYNYFYDTDAPNTRPWEMLGFSEEPDWWTDEYGPSPYTSGNLVLWNDLEQGIVRDPAGAYIIAKYRRPGLTSVIPTGTEGELLAPIDVMVGNYDQRSFRKSWTVGDDGPVESAWRKSSSWPFAVMRLLALTKPAEFFALFADRDLYKFNNEFDQYLYENRFRLQPENIQVYGNGVIKNSYINWIVDYNRQTGLDSTQDLKIVLENIDVRLCYRMASFSDKRYIKIFTEKSSPNSLNTSLLLPDESYQLLLYKNPSQSALTWSSVIIQKTGANQYTVYGYSTTRPYFEILASAPNAGFRNIVVNDTVVRAPDTFTNNIVQVPYGYEFVGTSAVVDFLLSYGAFMSREGMYFENQDGSRLINWNQMAQEFVYWTQQGWATGSLININPVADLLRIEKPGQVAEPLSAAAPEDILLNQNKQALKGQDYVVERLENELTLRAVNNSTFSYLNVKFTQFEHIIVFDNTSVFNDLIYNPATGARQSRLLFTGYTTYDWNGSLDAQGFILNQDNIEEWQPNTSYTKGQIVLYKDAYWSAVEIIPPKEIFDFSKWIKSDYDQIQKGLLPNAATNAENIRNFYDVNQANLENDADLLGFGLIGFRPRRYMQNLNLDDISQVNLYRQFLGTKGTIRAAEAFSQANLGKEVAEYNIFENWAIQRAIYGANANRSYFEIRLNEADLQSNPSTVQIIESQQPSTANQTVLVTNLWKQSYPITSPNILPTTTLTLNDAALPTAGYVNWDDADIKVFNYGDLDNIIANIDTIVLGTSVWVAKDNNYDWNIYRTNAVTYTVSQVRDNLNGTSTFTFAGPHGLTVNQKIVVKYFDPIVNGAYRVVSVTGLKTIVVELILPGSVTQLAGDGICFVFETMRVAQASDIADLSYSNSLVAGNQAWVDDDGTGNWVVLEKAEPFTTGGSLTVIDPVVDSRFGTAIAQGFNNLGAIVGAPGYDGIGGVYTYNKGGTAEFVGASLLTMAANNFESYGKSVSAGNTEWALAGAPDSWAKQGYAVAINRAPVSGSYVQSQLLTEVPFRLYQISGDGSTINFNPTSVLGAITDPTQLGVVVNDVVQQYNVDWMWSSPNVVFTTAPPDGINNVNIFYYDEYGHGVSISDDERWAYVSAPAGNRVYAYNRIDVQNQIVNFVGDGQTTSFDISSTVIVDSNPSVGASQLGVTVNGLQKFPSTDYVYDSGVVTFNTAPTTNSAIRIIRLQSKTFFPVAIDADAIETGKKYQILEVGTTDWTLVGAASNTIGVIFTATGTGAGTGNAGELQFDIESLYTATDIYSVSVYDNDVLLRPNMDYTFNTGTNTVEFLLEAPIGTLLFRSATHYRLISAVSADGITSGVVTAPTPDARFGYGVAATTDGRQLIISAPFDTADSKASAGRVFVVDRRVQSFIVTDSTQTVYTTAESFNGPATVKLNAEFLIPDGTNNNGQFVEISADSVQIQVPLTVGDTIEIETNQFKLMQAVQSNNPQTLAEFGYAIDQCLTNCSLYIGQPNDSTLQPEAGSLERFVNPARLYGIITGTAQNPVLTPGTSIRLNNVDVYVPATPPAWSDTQSWPADQFVISATVIYQSRVAVPAGVQITNTDFWQVSSWVELYANAVRQADIPNISAVVNNGYLTVSIANSDAALPFTQLTILPGFGNLYYVLGIEPMSWTQTITAPVPIAYAHFGASVSINDTARILAVGSPQGSAAKPTTFDNNTTFFDGQVTEFVDVLGASGVSYTFDLLSAANAGVNNPSKFVFGQQIFDPNLKSLDEFGTAVNISGGILLVGSPQNDLGDSVGDFGRVAQLNNIARTPAWTPIYREQPIVDVNLINSIFSYDRLESTTAEYYDFIDPLQGKILGAARQNIDYLGALDPAAYNFGAVNNFGNSWREEYVGKIWWDLSTVRFIDYHQSTIEYASQRWGQLFPGSRVDVYQWIESTVPPAEYTGIGTPYSTTSYSVNSRLDNTGLFTTRYFFWVRGIREVATPAKKTLSVETIARYIENPRASGIPYVAAIASGTLALYNAAPYISAQDTILHVEFDKIANTDNVHVEYDLIAAGNPNSFLGSGLYRKMLDSFCGEDTVGNKVPDAKLSPADRYGVQFRPRQSFFVDRFLALENYLQRANAILAQFPISDSKPLGLLNSEEPEPTASSGQWNKRVANYQELLFQDLSTVLLGYRYLVVSDETNDGLWTIYTVIAGTVTDNFNNQLLLSRVQNFDTKLYWEYIDWVQPGYNPSVRPVAEVATFNQLQLLTAQEGASAKVTRNSGGKFEIYQYLDGVWNRVILEDGTIRIKETLWNYTLGRFGFDVETFDSQRFDVYPAIETRQVIRAINDQLLTDELAIFKNELLLLVFEFILTEQPAPNWLFKTSLIDVNHKIRDLLPFQVFRTDNQDFVLDYIKEVKPYHVKIKEFNLKYEGFDLYNGNVTDFDCPAYLDPALNQFVSPILDDGQPPLDPASSRNSSWVGWTETPWNQWYQNYKLIVASANIIDAGQGYLVAPQVTVTGAADEPAEIVARVNSAGRVIELIVLNPGSGYTTTPILTLTGGNGTGARAVAVLETELVRNINTTIKYDRFEYVSQVVDWQVNTVYTTGQLVRFRDQVYAATATENSGAIFDVEAFEVVDQSTLNAADRVIGLYTPTVNEPGRELAQVMLGIEYPGVQVKGVNFNQNTGFDVGNYDINPFDNIDFGPEGLPTYDEGILDAVYQSSFTDTFLGTRAIDINVDGGAFIDTYNSHAPEELVPGTTFDTLDLRVYTRPGSDWGGDGHGWSLATTNLVFDAGQPTVSFAGLIKDPATLEVLNITTQTSLTDSIDYSINWGNQTVTIFTTNTTVGNVIQILVFGIGGGNQLFKQNYNGAAVGNELIIPVPTAVNWQPGTIYAQGDVIVFNNNTYRVNQPLNSGTQFQFEFYTLIDSGSVLNELLIIADGQIINTYTYESFNGWQTKIQFDTTYSSANRVVVTALGITSPQKSWSFPVTEYFIYDVPTTYTLSNSLQGTNLVNLVVERNGKRLRAPESVEYIGNGTTTGPYLLSTTGQILQSLISDNDVVVYVDQVRQILSVDYTVSPWLGTNNRFVEFVTAPPAGAVVLIAVTTLAEYTIFSENQLQLRVGAAPGSVISVTSFNDTSEQRLLTQVFKGPTTVGTVTTQPYDSTVFDVGNVTGNPGSFDYTAGTVIESNTFDTGRVILNSSRLIVTVNGNRLIPGTGYTVSGTSVTISGSVLGPGDIVVITSFAQSIVPDAIAFRIFQDMLGTQKIYRITDDIVTVLTQELAPGDDVIHVADASQLNQPNPAANIFGQVTINGERMTYRVRNTANNTVSGLRRGVAGTAIATHSVGQEVIDIGFGEALPQQYQQTINSSEFIGDGSTDTYVSSIDFDNQIQVFLGGTIQCFLGPNVSSLVELSLSEFEIVSIDPITIRLNTVPNVGQVFRIVYTPTVGSSSVLTVPTTGATSQWSAPFSVTDLVLQSVNDYNITDFSPVTVEFDTPVAADRVIVIGDVNSGETFVTEFETSINTVVSDISVTRAVQVTVGGVLVPDTAYTVSAIDPVTVVFDVAPAEDLIVEIYITQARVMYAQGVGTASDGQPLQEQQTQAAWFIEGDI